MKTTVIPQTSIVIADLNDACRWRAATFWQKEPATVGWLGSLSGNDVLWDVGANIGLYSLFAASRGAQVFAIECMIPNLYALSENMRLNLGLAKRITIVPLALSDVQGFTTLHLSSSDIASSCHAAGESVNYKLEPKDHWQGQQGIYTIRADQLAEETAHPSHVKIDVDGLEYKVITGFGDKNRSPLQGIKSFCIEYNPALNEHVAMMGMLFRAGFVSNAAQFEAARRTEGPFQGVGEIILDRVRP